MTTKVTNRNFFFILFLGVILLAYITIKPVLSTVILALIIASVFYPVYKRIMKVTGQRVTISVPATMLIIFLSVIIPVIIIGVISINQLNVFISDISEFAGNSEEIQKILQDRDDDESNQSFIETENSPQDNDQFIEEDTTETEITTVSPAEESVQKIIDDVNGRLDDLPFIDSPDTVKIENVKNLLQDITKVAAEFIGSTALNIAKNTPVFITNLLVFIIILATLIPSQQKLKEYFIRLSPLENNLDELYMKKVQAMSDSMVKGTFTIAVVQGIICGILFMLADVPYVFFWTLLCIFLLFIPNGGSLVNYPILIAVILSGNWIGALILAIGNLFIVSSIDNVLRPMLVSREAHLPAALTLIGVVGGIQAFGFFGFIYGPVVMIFLVTTFEVYINHYKGQ